MSSRTSTVREQDEDKSSGLGLAAAAAVVGVGLGIGAALYYFFKPDQQEAQHASGHRTDRQQHFESDYGYGHRPSQDFMTVDQDEMNQINEEIYRERAWTLEQCSICFEEMLASQRTNELWMLKCGHKFHLKCVQPWTLEHNTCPNCRKAI